MSASFFVWTKPGTEAGEHLADIIARKNAERIAGNGVFWWGIGNSLGPAVCEAAKAAGGTLPVIFCKMLGDAQSHDVTPTVTVRWKKWQDWDGKIADIPPFVRVTSRGVDRKGRDKRKHYALVCRSDGPIVFDPNGRSFDPRCCLTHLGKVPGDSQITGLLQGDVNAPHHGARYHIAFRAILIFPWQATLLEPDPLPRHEQPIKSKLP